MVQRRVQAKSSSQRTHLRALKERIIGAGVLYALALYLYDGPDRSNLFFWHPFAMLTAVMPLMSVGVFISKFNRTVSKSSKISNSWHNYLMICQAVITLLGAYAIYLNKERLGKAHFTTWHGFLGIIVVGCNASIALVSPFILWSYPNTSTLFETLQSFTGIRVKMHKFLTLHRLGGRVAYGGMLVVSVLGWFTLHSSPEKNFIAFWFPFAVVPIPALAAFSGI
eukprot:7129140-Pyramimonas_sp.AAC.1